jgi:hypothetical protein
MKEKKKDQGIAPAIKNRHRSVDRCRNKFGMTACQVSLFIRRSNNLVFRRIPV